MMSRFSWRLHAWRYVQEPVWRPAAIP
jgi:hypothetical protein